MAGPGGQQSLLIVETGIPHDGNERQSGELLGQACDTVYILPMRCASVAENCRKVCVVGCVGICQVRFGQPNGSQAARLASISQGFKIDKRESADSDEATLWYVAMFLCAQQPFGRGGGARQYPGL